MERELAQGVETYPYLNDALAFVRSEKVAVLEPPSDTRVSETLGSGETQVLAVVEERGGAVVTDDMEARSVAYDRGMDVTGSIGVLVRAVERSIIKKETANRCLSVWIEENGYRSPSEDITDFL